MRLRRNISASMTFWPFPSPKRAGFTLVELLVTLALFSIIIASIGAVLVPMRRSYTSQEVSSAVQQSVRMAVELMVNDIRLAGLDPMESANAGIEMANATSMRFTADRVPEGATESDGEIKSNNSERLTYYLEGSDQSLRLRTDEGTPSQTTQTLVNNVTNLQFRYFDTDGNETAALADIRAVQVTLTVEEDAGRDGTVERSYTTRVRCRNLGI